MENIQQIISRLVPARGLLLVTGICFFAIAAWIIVKEFYRKAKSILSEREKLDKERIKNINIKSVSKSMMSRILRILIAADGINPNQPSYMTIMDGPREKFVRTFTISQMPQTVYYAKTFNPMFHFKGCTSSIFIDPIPANEIGRKLDHAITILTSEENLAGGDINRRRKLHAQAQELTNWASDVEEGNNTFFDVGMLFSIYADSLQELNKRSDEFYALGVGKGIYLSACYGMQAEAYALNGPYNGNVKIQSKTIKKSCVETYSMDKYSVSTLLNFAPSSYSHKTGIPLGRDMLTGDPVIFDQYSPLHDSMSIAIAGKPGSGKSNTIKIMSARYGILGWHYVALDSQERQGFSEGEYAATAVALGGINIKVSNDARVRLNPFDVSETIKGIKNAADEITEIRTLDLSSKISSLVNIICSMALFSADKGFDSANEETYVRRVITDIATQCYEDFGIYDKDPDSLYESPELNPGLMLGTQRKRKMLPTLRDFYIRLLRANKANTDETLQNAYKFLIYGLEDRISELYYTIDSIRVISQEEYLKLPAEKSGTRHFVRKDGSREGVKIIKGSLAYYDGQSTVSINRDCPFTNFDISSLQGKEQKLAREICMDWITENFVKKNSETMDSTNKLVLILDEVHECFADPYAIKIVDVTVREARKRHVGIILSTQTMKEYDDHPETKSILKLVEVKFIFKQDYQDYKYLQEAHGLTASQANKIVNELGGNEHMTEDEKKRHKGEMCLIDNKNVTFCKVDYLKRTEALIADTNVAELQKLIHVNKTA